MNARITETACKGTVRASKRKSLQDQGKVSKRPRKTPHATPAGIFSCFTLDGNDVNLHRRSVFSTKRKEEVRAIRKKGACLRCRLLKRPCSGEDPCKTCIAAANAAGSSKVLKWMECIRPSFLSVNIFDNGHQALDRSLIDGILNDLLDDDVYLDFHIPFALNVEAASSHLARWLSDDEISPEFSVVGVFSCSTNTNLLQNALDPSLGRDLRLFVHLTTYLYTTGMQGGYQDYTDEEIQSVRDCVGSRLLLALDPLLRPSEIEASEHKLGKLKSLFLLLLGTVVGMRYTCTEVVDETSAQHAALESKEEALLRLLCHYLIYIGKATSLLEHSSDERTLLNKWRTQWNKPAAFTWNPSRGLEMHYRIKPADDWIVSSSEDESLNGIDIDLSEFDSVDEFTQNADLLKCSGCQMFWADLDAIGFCMNCGPGTLDLDWLAQPPPFLDDYNLIFESTMDSSILPSADLTTSKSQLYEGGTCTAPDMTSVREAPKARPHPLPRISVPQCGRLHAGWAFEPIEQINSFEAGASETNGHALDEAAIQPNCGEQQWDFSTPTDALQPVCKSQTPLKSNLAAETQEMRRLASCWKCSTGSKPETADSICVRCQRGAEHSLTPLHASDDVPTFPNLEATAQATANKITADIPEDKIEMALSGLYDTTTKASRFFCTFSNLNPHRYPRAPSSPHRPQKTTEDRVYLCSTCKKRYNGIRLHNHRNGAAANCCLCATAYSSVWWCIGDCYSSVDQDRGLI